ncbi:PH domain-containing protein [Rathayibacter tanaceti]|uniref:Bacterial membrane flanked domain protein n=2 Tax=Rathayibacter tanaceti TaxID=1671680 RepID=A0A166HBD1_9MICO|nr:PH domain-containing protein [Rathayibacter tanaceti]KZX20295.1 Bacterial membrane flanked domain protein [Rathayibacter tanaceti]QHC54583.1 PH domain-containing protein [Rathayibacter tanaceti]TCO33857.1 putative membrane protein [Rathayibacter tanaceti]
MTEPAAPAVETDLADGEWHRLHPATPVLKGGIGLLVVLGIIVTNLRERLVELFLPGPEGFESGDPVDELLRRGLVGWALLVVAVGLAVAVFAFWLSWRMHTFRITEEVVEVRSGVLFRTNRRARLDRIQGIAVQRPLFARLFGAAKLEVSVAGQDANVQLSYLGSRLVDALRRDILRLASGVREREAVAGEGPSGGFLARRLEEFGEPVDDSPPESVVSIPPSRLFGSLVFSGFTLFLAASAAAVVFVAVYGSPFVLFAILPGLIGSGSYYVRQFVRSLRYSIAATPDGVRVGYGVLSTSSDTLPPGRIHAVEITQPLLWRPFGWWQVKIDRAGHAASRGANGEPNTTILPVGDLAAVERVLGLLLPGTREGAESTPVGDALRHRDAAGFTRAPRSAVWLRPFSFRRTGYRLTDEAAILRSGAVWRRVAVVPLARMQSIGVQQGPLQRLLGLASARVHTVAGPVTPTVPVMSVVDALAFFESLAVSGVRAAGRDASHLWGRRAGGPVTWPAPEGDPYA